MAKSGASMGPGLSPRHPQAAFGRPARLPTSTRRVEHTVQLAMFCVVGVSGYVVNLAVFTVAFVVVGVHHVLAASLAFLVAMTNNFWWHRRWTFATQPGRVRFQGPRFVVVSVLAFALATLVLWALVDGVGTPAPLAQALAILVATPMNFIGNKLWGFRPDGDHRLRGGTP